MATALLVSPADLAELEEQAETIGVDLALSLDSAGIWIGRIERTSGRPGAGADAIASVCELADEAGIQIRAAVVEWNDPLIAYYEKLGFEPQPSEHCDEDYVVIVRKP